jgi:hypothetical protein
MHGKNYVREYVGINQSPECKKEGKYDEMQEKDM